MQTNKTKKSAGLEFRREKSRRVRLDDIVDSIHKLVNDVYEDDDENPIKLSVEKWGILREIAEAAKDNMWAEQCPLCKAFPNCEGCPVAEAAGTEECKQTPWTPARDAANNLFFRIDEEIEFLSELQ